MAEHEDAVKAAMLSVQDGCDITPREMRKALAAFLRAVDPSHKMIAAGTGRQYAGLVFEDMCRALAEEIDNAKG